MRSLMMTNRIQVITRPATSGFNFPCFKQPQNVIANIGKEGHDQDWDRNRYRRKQALQVKKMLLLPSVSETKRYRRFFIYKFWGVSSAGRASVLQAEGRRFETCTLHWTISITDRILRYERRGIGSTPIWSTCAIYASIDVSLALQVLILLRRMHPAIAGRSISLKSSAQKQMLLFNNIIEWEKTGTSLTHLWVSYNGQYICLPNKWCEFDSRYPLTTKYASIAQLVEQL